MDFNDVIGHEDIIRGVQESIKNQKISHSYLFQGEESIGKKKLGLVFAKTLLCKEKGLSPCNTCSSCLKFDTENHPDFLYVGAEKNLIKKDKIDGILKDINTYPLEGDRKIIFIDDSNCMRVDTQNSILKTLEEPPKYINIFLVTNNINDIIGTIQSRCQILKFYPVEGSKIEEVLTRDYDIPRDRAKFIANFTKGAVGKSIEISQSEEFFSMREELLDLVKAIVVNKDKGKIFQSKDFFDSYKDRIYDILDMLIYWFRDIYIYKEIGENPLIINRDRYSDILGQSFLSFNKINDIIEGIIDMKSKLLVNVNYQLGIETMLLNMQEVDE